MEASTEKPFISFILPVYNVEKYLDACLSSFSNQTYRNFEIIAINDGSNDRSSEILRTYSTRLESLRIFDQMNRGLGAARNAGIEKARGEWIAFVDSDDCIDAKYCETLHESARDDVDIIEFNMRYLGKGDKYWQYEPPIRWKNLWPEEMIFPLEKIRFEDFDFWGPADAKAYLTDYYGDYMTPPPPEKRISEHSVGQIFPIGPNPHFSALKWKDYHG